MSENLENRISSEQAKDAIYQAHLSKDAISKIGGLQSTYAEIDNIVTNGATKADLDALVIESGSLTVAQSTKLAELANFEPFPTMWDKNATNYTELKTAVKSVKIYGTGMDLSRKFYLSFFRKNSFNTTRLEVSELFSDATTLKVSSISLANPYIPTEDLTTITLSSVNNSGINVEIKLLWSAIPDGFSKITESYAKTGFNASTTFSEMSFGVLNTTTNEVASSKVISEYVNNKVSETLQTATNNMDTEIHKIYSESEELIITPFVQKALGNYQNYSDLVSNSVRKTSRLIDAEEGETIFIKCAKKNYSSGFAFDVNGDAIAEIPYNQNYILPSQTKAFAFASDNADMDIAKAYKIKKTSIDIVNDLSNRKSKDNISANLWDADFLVPFSSINSSTGKTRKSTDRSSTKFIEVEENETYLFGSWTNLQTREFAFYDKNHNFVSGLLLSGGSLANYNLDSWYKSDSSDSYFTELKIPSSVKYIKFIFHASEADFTKNLVEFRIVKKSNYEILLNKEIKSQEKRNYDFLKKEISIMTNTLVSLSTKNVAILGDSISARGGYQGWVRQFNNLLKPKNIYNYAAGGKTMTERSGYYFEDLITYGDDSFCARLEKLIKDYVDGVIERPDILLSVGCTNDFTTIPDTFLDTSISGEYGTEAYEKYVESEFFTDSETATYASYVAKPLNTVNISKITGAMRYIVERALTYFPDIKIFFFTPIQSASHKISRQRRCVNDMKYACERLNLPLIDQWGRAGTPMILDYPGNGSDKLWFPDGDGVHPFGANGVKIAAEIHGRFIVNELIKNYQFDVELQP